ncbi:MAG: serine hydrolase domain-containing protein [Alphaproteobacteria bacterium]|nr:serine hydrolase domain-containing protein [Alphaproteobacteria bacterium]
MKQQSSVAGLRRACSGLALALALAGCAALPGGGGKSVDPQVSSIVTGEPATLGFDPAKLEAIRTALSADVASGKIPGAYLIIGRQGQAALKEGFGVQGPGQTAPMSEETIFRIFSMTKPIISVTAMTLVEDGKLSVDDPVSKYLPEFGNLKVMQADGSTRPSTTPMLVRHLMSHTSGLIYGFVDANTALGKAYAAGGENRTDVTTRDYAKLIGALPLKAEPGVAWNYSRATDVLGALVEVAGGKPLDVLVRERVTGPLGMTDTAFFQPAANAARFAQSKSTDGLYYDYTKATPMLSGGGGLSSTPEDYLRFALMLANRGEYKGVRIIEPATLARMTTDETTADIRSKGVFFPGPGVGFGLGFSLVLDETRQRPGAGTFSWNGIAGTEFWVDPKNDLFMAFFIQDRALLAEYQRKNRAWIYDALKK